MYFNTLHICDFRGKYNELPHFLDCPGHVISYVKELGGKEIQANEVAKLFQRPVMGEIDRNGIIVTGNKDQIKTRGQGILKTVPEKFILGADCTLPDNVNWKNVKPAISNAHSYIRE